MDNIKYLENGQKVVYVGEISGKHAVKPFYYDEEYDEEFESDEPRIVGRVFDRPPVAVFDKQIEQMKSQIQDLVNARMQARNEMIEARKEQKQFEESYVNHPQFQRIKNLLSGKVRYVVDLREFRVESAYSERYYHVARFHLDRVHGEFKWILREDNDSSLEHYPAHSKDEAIQILRDYISRKLIENGNWADWYKERLIKAANEHGVDIPVSFTEAENARKVKEAQAEVEELRKSLAVKERQLEALMVDAL